jgi:formate/nitrite transporter FocA (FNT family)
MPAGSIAWMAGLQNLLLSTLGNLLGGSLLALGLAYGHDALRENA